MFYSFQMLNQLSYDIIRLIVHTNRLSPFSLNCACKHLNNALHDDDVSVINALSNSENYTAHEAVKRSMRYKPHLVSQLIQQSNELRETAHNVCGKYGDNDILLCILPNCEDFHLISIIIDSFDNEEHGQEIRLTMSKQLPTFKYLMALAAGHAIHGDTIMTTNYLKDVLRLHDIDMSSIKWSFEIRYVFLIRRCLNYDVCFKLFERNVISSFYRMICTASSDQKLNIQNEYFKILNDYKVRKFHAVSR